MDVPIPVLVAIAAALPILLLLALRRRGADRDLIAPPPSLGRTPQFPGEGRDPDLPLAPLDPGLRRGTSPSGDAPVALPEGVEANVRQLIREQRKIEAIKIVRHATGMGLAEAKDYVERM